MYIHRRLKLETDVAYAQQTGFTDPCKGLPKQLRISYMCRGRRYVATIDDAESVTLPSEGHRIDD